VRVDVFVAVRLCDRLRPLRVRVRNAVSVAFSENVVVVDGAARDGECDNVRVEPLLVWESDADLTVACAVGEAETVANNVGVRVGGGVMVIVRVGSNVLDRVGCNEGDGVGGGVIVRVSDASWLPNMSMLLWQTLLKVMLKPSQC
jgi:hypothetical protein